MRKIRKSAAVLLAAVMVLAMGMTVFAADAGTTYLLSTTLYKGPEINSGISKGDAGIKSVVATIDESGETAAIVITTQDIELYGFKGTLSGLTLYANGEAYTGTVSGYTITINGFPADELETGAMIEGSFTTSFPIMGTRTGYLHIDSMTEQ